MTNVCDQHDRCQLQCSVENCRSYECQDADHRWSPWLHRRDWEAIMTSGLADDMPVDRELYYNERGERMP
jgi:hypothetical protein